MTDIRIVRDYPHPPEKVWRALTEPPLMKRWGMRPEGYAPTVGARFRLIGKANSMWRGYVDCEVLEVREGAMLRYAWDDDGRGAPTQLTYRLEPHPGGTRLTVEHTGFRGISGFVFAKLIMTPGWGKILGTTLPALLGELDGEDEWRRGGRADGRTGGRTGGRADGRTGGQNIATQVRVPAAATALDGIVSRVCPS